MAESLNRTRSLQFNSYSGETRKNMSMFWLRIAVLVVVLGMCRADWETPDFCEDKPCPEFMTMDVFHEGNADGQEEYSVRRYQPMPLICLYFNSSIPHTENDYYTMQPGKPRYDNYVRLVDYINGANAANQTFTRTVPIFTWMYDPGTDTAVDYIQDLGEYDGEDLPGEEWVTDPPIVQDDETSAETGSLVVKDFRICLYLDMEDNQSMPPAANDQGIEIFRQPSIAYYTMGFSHETFDASQFVNRLDMLATELQADGNDDFLQEFQVHCSYDPDLGANSYNEVMMYKTKAQFQTSP